jgi:choline dehydrogenase
MTRQIGNSGAFAEWNDGEFWPSPELDSDAQLTEYIEESISTWFHPVGTCRMGVGGDCVVDPKLGVIGASGLHVADASVMPEIVSVNTNAASMMIGWRAADLFDA